MGCKGVKIILACFGDGNASWSNKKNVLTPDITSFLKLFVFAGLKDMFLCVAMEWVAVVQTDSFSSSMAGRLIQARYKLILHIRLVLEKLAQSPLKTTKVQASCVQAQV